MAKPPKQLLMGNKMAIRGGLYREYFRQDISYLKQLCYFRGLDYYDREWSSLLLSLAVQGKLSQEGKFDVHFIGDFDQDLDSSSAVCIYFHLITLPPSKRRLQYLKFLCLDTADRF